MDVRINGIIVPDDDVDFYEWFGISAFSPTFMFSSLMFLLLGSAFARPLRTAP